MFAVEHRKRDKHATVCSSNGFDFVPFRFSVLGSFAPLHRNFYIVLFGATAYTRMFQSGRPMPGSTLDYPLLSCRAPVIVIVIVIFE